MTKLYLKYNPFSVISNIIIDDKEIGLNDKLYEWREERLSIWIDQLLPELAGIYYDNKFDITFHGIQTDYEKLKNHIDNYLKNNDDQQVLLDFIKANSIEDRILRLIDLLEFIQKESTFDALRIDDIQTNINDKLLSDIRTTGPLAETTLIIKTAVDTILKRIKNAQIESHLQLDKFKSDIEEIQIQSVKVENQLEEIKKGIDFIKKVSMLDISDETKRNIDKKLNEVIHELNKHKNTILNNDKITENNFISLQNEFITKINELKDSVNEDLLNIIKSTIIKTIKEYELCIKTLIKDNEINAYRFDSEYKSGYNVDFVLLDDKGRLINDKDCLVSLVGALPKLSISRSWGKIKITIDKEKQIMDFKNFFVDRSESFKESILETGTNAKEIARNEEDALLRFLLLNQVDVLPKLSEQKTLNLQQLTSDKQTIEKSIQSNKMKEIWLKELIDNLNNIIEIQ